MNVYLQKLYQELKLRNYSRNTIKIYLKNVADYLKYKRNNLNMIDLENIKSFLLHQQNLNKSSQTVNLYLNAIKFFYLNIVKSPVKIDIKCAKRPQKLPVVLSRDEIRLIIDSISNIKHKTMIALAYASGLRVSEVVNLKVQDVDFYNLVICVRQGKGKKDRITKFSDKLTEYLKNLAFGKQGFDYVFASKHGSKLSCRTAQKIFAKALQANNIQKNASFHSLRHSFATHLLENNTSIRVIQELLGHNNIRTTQRYTMVSCSNLLNVASPL